MLTRKKTYIENIVSGEYLNGKLNFRYIVALSVSSVLLIIGVLALWYTLQDGLIIWGIDNNISWGFAIINFVFWIGIAHAGTLISAILYLLNQEWRISFNRMAELMTIIAISIAAIFPLIHTGRPWFATYWLLPYYNQMGLLPNFKSALSWDIVAILTYFLLSLIFFYIGLLPDLSLLSSKIKNKTVNKLYRFLSDFWHGTKEQWEAHRAIYLIIAGLATPLVISVHSIVSFDFYVTLVKSWHTAILPPYFVLGAIFSGLAMVNVITIFYNYLNNSLDSINIVHFDKLNKLMLFTSLAIAFIYFIELSTAFVDNKWTTDFAPLISGGIYVYLMLIFNVAFPLFLVFKRIRRNKLIVFITSILVLIGMWLERYVIIITGQEGATSTVENPLYTATIIDYMLVAGAFGAFLLLFLLIAKIFPINSISERVIDEQ